MFLSGSEEHGPGLSDRMVKSCHVTCRVALDKAVTLGLILKNPALACKAPATHPKEMQVLMLIAFQDVQDLCRKDDGSAGGSCLGHVSSATTLNVYAHVTDEMRQSAAAKIDRAIAKAEPQPETAALKKPTRTSFREKRAVFSNFFACFT